MAETIETSSKSGMLNSDSLYVLLSLKPKELVRSGDAFFEAAWITREEGIKVIEAKNRIEEELKVLQRRLTNAFMEYRVEKGEPLYPDGNRSLRFTYGYVKGYSPRDAVYYEPFSSFRGILEKNTDKKPFNMPEHLKALLKNDNLEKWKMKKLGFIPVNFLSNNDTTGGSSGSPVLDSEGNLAGVLFDGNYEALTSDYKFDEEKNRCISVDIRYILMITELYEVTDILEEINPDK